MEDLAQWLRAQLDEDQRLVAGGTLQAVVPPDYDGMTRDGMAYIVGPVRDRMLREIDAKRRVVAKYEAAKLRARDSWGADVRASAEGEESAYEAAVQLLALPYSDRPGYRDEWRP